MFVKQKQGWLILCWSCWQQNTESRITNIAGVRHQNRWFIFISNKKQKKKQKQKPIMALMNQNIIIPKIVELNWNESNRIESSIHITTPPHGTLFDCLFVAYCSRLFISTTCWAYNEMLYVVVDAKPIRTANSFKLAHIFINYLKICRDQFHPCCVYHWIRHRFYLNLLIEFQIPQTHNPNYAETGEIKICRQNNRWQTKLENDALHIGKLICLRKPTEP